MLRHYPLLRILMPFVAGIIICYEWRCGYPAIFATFCCGAAVYALLNLLSRFPFSVVAFGRKMPPNFRRKPSTLYRLRGFQIVPIAIIALCAGMFCTKLSFPDEIPNECHGRFATARVLKVKQQNASTMTDVVIENIKDCNNFGAPKMRLVITENNYAVRENSILAFRLNPSRITNRGNPGEFDYKEHMMRRGVLYEQVVKPNECRIVERQDGVTTLLADWRSTVTESILSTRVSEDAKGWLAAMLVGVTDFIDPGDREVFSAVGVAHVLALSGLHVGILAFVVWFLLFPLDYLLMRRLRLVVTIVMITFYAVFTGLSVTIVRSAVMIIFSTVAFIFYRKNSALNALIFAAFVILVFSPMALYEIGFQLSFISVLALVLLTIHFPANPKMNFVLRYTLSLLMASATTSLATFPLTAFYFHKVSFAAVFANMLIIPILPVFIVAGVVLVFATMVGVGQGFCADAVEWVHRAMSAIIEWFFHAPFSHLGNVHLSALVVMLIYIALAMLFFAAAKRRLVWLVAGAGMIVVSVCAHMVIRHQSPQEGIVVFNDFSTAQIACFSHGRCVVWTPHDSVDAAAFERRYSGFMASMHIDSVVMVNGLRHKEKDILIRYPYAMMMGKRIAVADSHFRDSVTSPIDILLVDKKFYKSIASLRFRPKMCVITADVFHTRMPQLESECHSLRIPCHTVRKQGAYLLTPPATTK